MEIDEPSVIARLPRLQIENGRYQFSPVHSLRNGVKRIRQEICAAVDGDSINIYEIQNGKTLASHPVPLDTTFPCAPYAVRVQNSNKEILRNIYYVGRRRNELTLSVSEEGTGRFKPVSSCKTVNLEDTSPVVQLEILPEIHTAKLIVVRECGSFEIFDGRDLSLVKTGTLGGIDGDDQLVSVRWLSSSQALESVLKARPDLVIGSEANTSFVVGVFTNSTMDKSEQSKAKIGVWELSSSFVQNPVEVNLSPLFYHKFMITSPLLDRNQNPVTMVRKDTLIVLKTQSKIYTYDLTLIFPHKVCEASLAIVEQLSSVPLSGSLILSSTPNSLQVHNTSFGTLQSKLDLTTNSLKRKRTSSSSGHVVFFSYFPKLGRAIAIRRGHLVAVDVRNTTGGSIDTAIKRTSLLVNNFGRGILSQDRPKTSVRVAEASIGKLSNLNEQTGQWQKVAKQFEELCRAHDTTGFAKLFAEHVTKTGIKTSRQTKTIPDWKANAIISKIFEIPDASQGRVGDADRTLRLTLPAYEVLTYLADYGLLTAEKVFRALGAEFEPSSARHEYRHFIDALIESDSTLGVVRKHLMRTAHANRWETCASIHLLLQRALSGSSIAPSSDDTGLQVSVADIDADHSLNQQISNSREAASIRSCLCIAVERICDLAPSSLSVYMREHFQQTEIVALIQFLRQQLFRSGYTTSIQTQTYPTPPASEPDVEGQDVALYESDAGITLNAIASALSDCIDAIGPTGFLNFGEEGEFLQTLIPELCSEISRATEALQDTTLLRGFLRETLRFGESASDDRHQAIITGANSDKTQPRKPGSIVTLYTESSYGGLAVDNAALLPLGSRAEGKISTHKVRKGDGSVLKRSDREMGMLQERLRGPYALERLVI